MKYKEYLCRHIYLTDTGGKKLPTPRQKSANPPAENCHKNNTYRIIHRNKDVCDCTEKRKSIKQMEQSGLRDVINQYRFDTFICEAKWQSRMLSTARAYASSATNEWLFFGGQTGAGKTHLCTAVCREFLRQGIPVKYMMWKDLSKELKRLATDSAKYENKLNICKNAEVLYIDDLFKGKTTEPDIDLAFEIINYRYAKRLKTIISSELTTDKLAAIDRAITGRIVERAAGFVLNIGSDEKKNFRLLGITEQEKLKEWKK